MADDITASAAGVAPPAGVAPSPASASKTGSSSTTINAKESTLPWVEKYRPAALEEVVAHEEILSTLRRLMDSNQMPHLLFYGPPGTGKTTTVKACAAYLYGKERLKANVLEMNASDDRGIDVVRNQIKEFASTGSIFSSWAKPKDSGTSSTSAGPNASFKLIILDEADQMSSEAQAALRRVIEKYTRNVRFCIICNHVNKVIPAIQSRCTRFRFGPVKKSQMLPRLTAIAAHEGVPCDEGGLTAAFRLSNGDMRRCLNMLQAAALSQACITEDSVYAATGNPSPKEVRAMLEVMLQKDFATAWDEVSRMVTAKGASVVDIIREMYPLFMKMSLPQDCLCFLLTKFADVEYYGMSGGAQESTSLAGILGALQLVKESVTSKVPLMRLVKC